MPWPADHAASAPGGVATMAPVEEEVGHGGLPGQNWFEDEPRRPWLLITVCGVLFLAIVVLVGVFLTTGGDGSGGASTASRPPDAAAPPVRPSGSVPPGAPAGARPVPPDRQAALAPQSVAVGSFAGQLQVTWDPPREPDSVSGYLVVAQAPDGAVQERRVVQKDANLSIVFSEPSTCAVVTTVVGTPEGLQLARGNLTCAAATRPERSS